MNAEFVQILLPKPFDEPFDYAVPTDMQLVVGNYVRVPFGKNHVWGVVWGMDTPSIDIKKIRKIAEKSPMPPMPQNLRKLIEWVASYTVSPLGNVLAMAISVPAALENPKPEMVYDIVQLAAKLTTKQQLVADTLQQHGALPMLDLIHLSATSRAVIKRMEEQAILTTKQTMPQAPKPSPTAALPHAHYTLSAEQKTAVEHLQNTPQNQHHVTLIDGVTGSGKTAVYLEYIAQVMQQNKQVLVLLPEIILTNQFIQRFEARFGFSPTQWHSHLTPATRRNNWQDVATGKARLVVGARSALFLPFQNLGLIVVDEEHEPAFKQEEGVIYHGRDMAVVRSHIEAIPTVLASASPSVETMVNLQSSKYDVIHLHSRFGEAVLPDIKLVDMREEHLERDHFLSPTLQTALAETMVKKQQSLLFLNRRGFAPLTLCRACGFRFESPESSAWMVLHKGNPDYLMCHHSGYRIAVPKRCPKCEAEESFAACGPGVERIEQEVQELFPQASTALMTSDSMASPKEAARILNAIESGEVDIIIGTQMTAKGHHFPKLTTVGVVDGDLGLDGGDPRASEKTYQLLQQVAGRAGREATKGQVFIQSYQPEHGVMQALAHAPRDVFMSGEIDRRKAAHLPPFSRMAALIVQSPNETALKNASRQLASCAPRAEQIEVLGPVPAPIYRLRNNYRMRFLLIAPKNINLQASLRSWLASVKLPHNVATKVDIDPQSFL